ncbi:DUF2235 domain-containing protein [Ferrovum sp.]|jgi:hypothetical protein|uniref:phospholipase effector Tle1 domain-containing protein n=1 Tax=Ferrovum sp. TaxID=2609467 RepID=UPI0026337E9D|nr:DUF2235 domain-containing protein [Ferrovum sp.]
MKNRILAASIILFLSVTIQAGLLSNLTNTYESHISGFVQSEHDRLQSNFPDDAFSYDCTPGKFSNRIETIDIDQAQLKISHANVTNIYKSDPHSYLIFIASDGTGKNSSAIMDMTGQALVDYLNPLIKSRIQCLNEREKLRKIDLSKLVVQGVPEQFPSNLALLAWLVKHSSDDHVRVIYSWGVGADQHASLVKNTNNSATGDTLMNQVNDAYNNASKEVLEIHAKDPNASFVFVTTGFSRGAAAARILNNMILDRGFLDHYEYIIQPGKAEIGVSLLYDTVITQRQDILHGKAINDSTNISQKIDSRAYEISSKILQVLQISARNEYRKGFELKQAIGRNVIEISLPGSHSDIGGGYGFHGISAVTLKMGISFLSKAGVPMGILPSNFMPISSDYVIHDSRKFPIIPFDEQLKLPRQLNTR